MILGLQDFGFCQNLITFAPISKHCCPNVDYDAAFTLNGFDVQEEI